MMPNWNGDRGVPNYPPFCSSKHVRTCHRLLKLVRQSVRALRIRDSTERKHLVSTLHEALEYISRADVSGYHTRR